MRLVLMVMCLISLFSPNPQTSLISEQTLNIFMLCLTRSECLREYGIVKEPNGRKGFRFPNTRTQDKQVLDYKRANFELMKEELGSYNYEVFMNNKNAEEYYMILKDKIATATDHHIPRKRIRPTNNAPWFSQEIKRLINARQHSYRRLKRYQTEHHRQEHIHACRALRDLTSHLDRVWALPEEEEEMSQPSDVSYLRADIEYLYVVSYSEVAEFRALAVAEVRRVPAGSVIQTGMSSERCLVRTSARAHQLTYDKGPPGQLAYKCMCCGRYERDHDDAKQ
ncbi:hypothetical protein FHG87_002338 [Trinorchestia longiramus]|nr:hypothetical protein FHG87_002338 [Trinorchestia longiramus]